MGLAKYRQRYMGCTMVFQFDSISLAGLRYPEIRYFANPEPL
jgi:hypothetical protein